MGSRSFHLIYLTLLLLASYGCQRTTPPPSNVLVENWDAVLEQAQGATVKFAMWDGDPMINAYMRDFVAPKVHEQFGLHLEIVGGQGNSIVSKLMTELESGRTVGDVDLIWINGETFYQMRQLNALLGPYTDRLPNNQYVDWDNPMIAIDFQKPVEGYECPWGNVQLAIIYHSERVDDPPKSMAELTTWVKAHPGRFTFDSSFTGMTFLKSLLYEIAGDDQAFAGNFDEKQYAETSAKLWAYLLEIKPFLWRRGETFPESVSQLHQMLANNEVDFSMSNNDGEVDNKAIQGILPDASRGYILDAGTIQNSHYLGIPINAPNPAAAMVLANFLISPEAQFEKSKPAVWGDSSVLAIVKLPEDWQARFDTLEGRTRVPAHAVLSSGALMEPSPELMVRLSNDFRAKIIEGQ